MKGKAIAGLVLGIVGIVFAILGYWFAVLSLPISIVGLILAILGGKELKAANEPSGIATAGLVLGIIAVVISAISFFTCGLCTICVASTANQFENELEQALNQLGNM
ncbi:MAG: DUF4190 domain-containing protein [Clostridia bacterium]|nr:DUF4190 domain-containing protein [Clostridia bacterium]